MHKKILLISTCKEKLHELEFVKPVEEILKNGKLDYFTKNYKDIEKEDLDNYEKIIICGTSLKDNDFLNYIANFEWIKETRKPILGICAGMQIIGLVFGGRINNKIEIGFYSEDFKKEFLGLMGKQEVYHLHNNFVDFPKEFEEFTNSNIPQAVRHKNKEIYGVLFHPEVRNKEVILDFCKK